MPLEIECKVPVADPAALAARLRAEGAVLLGRNHERNWVFDTPDNRLRSERRLLRVRELDGAGAARLTVKGPPAAGGFKTREEVETMVESAAAARHFCATLGCVEVWFYEKIRQDWEWDRCHVSLDEAPELGTFLEIEGPDEAEVAARLRRLGIDPASHRPESYLELFRKHCEARGETLRAMRFPSPGR